MIDLLRRYGDDPVMVSENRLREINQESDKWVATPKYDGWRRFIYWTGELTLLSKSRGKAEEARKPLPTKLMDQLRGLVQAMPEGMAWDVEWMGPRCHCEHHLIVHDILYSAGDWVGHLGYEKRHPLLEKLWVAAKAAEVAPDIKIVQAWRGEDFEALYEAQRENPLSEGLVLKKAGVALIQSDVFKVADKVLDNPSYVKVKYRDVSAADMARRKIEA